MRKLLLLFFLLSSVIGYSQYSHLKEAGWKGKIKKITCIYYSEAVLKNNTTWVPKDSLKYSYKTISYFNSQQCMDSVQTYLLLNGREQLSMRKGYSYTKGSVPAGWHLDNLEDIRYSTSWEWIDKNTYSEVSSDATGKNSIHSKVYMDDKFRIIKREMQLYREGELFDNSITEIRYSPDNTNHVVFMTENKITNQAYSQDEYITDRDKTGNPVKTTLKEGGTESRSIKYYIIEYEK